MAIRKSVVISGAVVVGAALWYLFRPDALVISKTVDEPFPTAQESAMGESSIGSSMGSMGESSMGSSKGESSMGSSMGDAAMGASGGGSPGMAHSSMANSSAMGGSPEADPVRLVSGKFHTNAHETKGVATIYRLDDGRRVLRLTEFATSNGPDLRVYVVAAGDVQDEAAAKQAGFVDLGALKGNIGDQNYDVPADLDLSKYQAVSIWCRRFSVNFGAAPLAEAM